MTSITGTVPGRFDPELFLRLVGEKAVLNPERDSGFPWGTRMVVMASAFCAVGLLHEASARQLVGDYRAALFRGFHHGYLYFPEDDGDGKRVVELEPEPVAECKGLLKVRGIGKLLLHYVVFGRDRASIEIDIIGSEDLPDPKLTVTDDHNNSIAARFNGSGHAGAWRGQLVTEGPLAADTEWLRLNRTTVGLNRRSGVSAVVEPLPAESPSEQHLRMAVADAVAGVGWFPRLSDNLQAAYEALFAAGLIEADSHALAELRAVADTFPLHPHQPTPRPDLPNPWRSLVERREAGPGAEGAAAIGVVTPPIDGITVKMDGLVSRTDGFEIRVATSPAVDVTHAKEMDPAPRPRIIWWAHDALGGHYIGRMGNVWSMGDGIGTGAIRFWPLLNPQTRTLTLTPTGRSSRAVVKLNDLSWAPR